MRLFKLKRWLIVLIMFLLLLILIVHVLMVDFKSRFKVENSKRIIVNNKRLFCMILTQPVNIHSKARAVDQTWAKECDKYFFILRLSPSSSSSDESKTLERHDPLPILEPANYKHENYTMLTDKMFETYKYVYHTYSDYDWYLKADDDTYVFVNHLQQFLKDKDPSAPITFGHNWKTAVSMIYESGGAGYVLSREAMKRLGEKLTKNFNYCLNTGVEDIDTAWCLRRLNVTSSETRDQANKKRFNAYSIKQEFKRHGMKAFSNSVISFHYMEPHEMRKLDKLMKTNNTRLNFTSILYSMAISGV